MEFITVENTDENMNLIAALRHRYVLLCESHLAYEKNADKAMSEGDSNMTAYWEHKAYREWERCDAVLKVIQDLKEEMES